MKKIYDTHGQCIGEYIPDCAGFKLHTLNLPAAWEYIYQNRDVLMKVDQFGPVYAQADPPGDVMIFRRENGQKFSNWIVWLQKEGGESFNNFFRPQLNGAKAACQPKELEICYTPEMAVYRFTQDNLSVKTTFTIPIHGKEIVMQLAVKNLSSTGVKLRLCPYLIPYLNQAQLAPWDKNEWYLRSGYGNEQNKAVFWTRLLNPAGDGSKRRTMTLFADKEDLQAVEISLEKFIGNGSAYCPEYAVNGTLRMPADCKNGYGDYRQDTQVYAYPPVYAMEYRWELGAGEERVLTMVLSMPEDTADYQMAPVSQAVRALDWFDEKYRLAKLEECRSFYNALYHKNEFQSPEPFLNYYINTWLPVQMHWVASLDRGWPSGMRGTRDSANDYTAFVYSDSKSCKKVLTTLLSCQRSDGWFPRQYAASGRSGNHDLRPYVDGGVFVLEFFYRYMAYTDDRQFLDLPLLWLDCEQPAPVWAHMKAAMEYYIKPQNIGEHGLCKIGGGDWLDPVNNAGLRGKGESVTVTCQAIIALHYMAQLCKYYHRDETDIVRYEERAQQLQAALLQHARNPQGWFNSVCNDNGDWIFSDRDPDGEERPYGPANWYAVSSGAVEIDRLPDVFKVMEKLKSPFGYRLFYPAMGIVPMDCVGRIASGDAPPYMAENGNVYNQGSHGYLARALAAAGMGTQLLDVIKWMLPCYEEKHPAAETMTAPYAIVNCWQQLPVFPHRGMLSFLTGSVAMCARGIYEWLCGIEPVPGGLEISPCMPEEWNRICCKVNYCEKSVQLTVCRTGLPGITVNGTAQSIRRITPLKYRPVYFVPRTELSLPENYIKITF